MNGVFIGLGERSLTALLVVGRMLGPGAGTDRATLLMLSFVSVASLISAPWEAAP